MTFAVFHLSLEIFLNGLPCIDVLEKGLICCTIFSELYRGAMTSSMEREFGRGDIGINRGFGDSFGRLGRAGCILLSFFQVIFLNNCSLLFYGKSEICNYSHNLLPEENSLGILMY
jgi:hypothetical protein